MHDWLTNFSDDTVLLTGDGLSWNGRVLQQRIAQIDDGFLFIDGRRKNLLISSYGRNISPEWPESVLLGTGAIAQAVYGYP